MANIFLEKIILEEKMCYNSKFSVVKDADPIIDNHFLLFPNFEAFSLADVNADDVINFLNTSLSQYLGNRKYMLLERGRASFCTSLDGIIHAHAHIVPTVENVEELFDLTGINVHENILDALNSILPDEQYLLWGQLDGKFYTVQPLLDVPKRIIRNSVRDKYRTVRVI